MMLGRNHAFCGVIAGTALASFVAPHPAGWFEAAGAYEPDGVGGLAVLALRLVGAALATVILPGMALPEAWVPNAPPLVLLLIVATTGGAALLPDLDHPSATVARSLGPVTRALAWAIDHASIGVYEATAGPRDKRRQNGHRLLTHTVPGALGFGVIALAIMAVPPVPVGDGTLSVPVGALVPTLLAALLALGAPGIGATFAVGTGTAAVIAFSQGTAWVPLLAVAVTVGCLAHVAGDAVTVSGVPLAWPVERDGQRWRMVRTPVTFRVGSATERLAVGPAVMTLAAASTALGAVTAGLGAVAA
jgi:hypothetical protein